MEHNMFGGIEKVETPPFQFDAFNSGKDEIFKSVPTMSTSTVTNVLCGKSGKNITDKKLMPIIDENVKVEVESESNSELLGSVTMHRCPGGIRTSARVIQKMKLDQIRPVTPPPTAGDRELYKRGGTIGNSTSSNWACGASEDKTDKQKTPSQIRSHRPMWTNTERNHFFDALNEVGKDFEAIGNYINSKLKRKIATDSAFKTKDQIRQHYYQTYHKISKYVKFADEIKKPVQELYALINYGEMRRKLQFVTDKHFMKLNNLVYQGHVVVRCKGKNIRVKTPSCKALRRLNQLDDSLEDIRLPSKIEVILSPANMEAFGRVQTIAQNPRVRTTAPLHKKLINFIKTFQYKWRSNEIKLAEEEARFFLAHNTSTTSGSIFASVGEHNCSSIPMELQDKTTVAPTSTSFRDADICFLPKPGITIHRPLLSITEYLRSVNICLTSYEERLGLKEHSNSVSISQDRFPHKRQRTDSGSEKRSPDSKKQKQITINVQQEAKLHESEENGDEKLIIFNIKEESVEGGNSTPTHDSLETSQQKCESSGDELNDEMQDLLIENEFLQNDIDDLAANDLPPKFLKNPNPSDLVALMDPNEVRTQTQPCHQNIVTTTHVISGVRSRRANNARSSSRGALSFKPLISDATMKRIRKGWTISNASDITLGDLYVVLGQDCKLELEYYWTDKPNNSITNIGTDKNATSIAAPSTLTTSSSPFPNSLNSSSSFVISGPSSNYTISESGTETVTNASTIFTQKQHGMPYNPSECDNPNVLKSLSTSLVGNKLKHLLLIANLSERLRKRQCSCGHMCERNIIKSRFERDLAVKSFVSNKTYASAGGANTSEGAILFRQPMMPIRRPILNMDPVKQFNTLTRQKMSRQVLVQRLILPGAATSAIDVPNMHNSTNSSDDIHDDFTANSQEGTATTTVLSPITKINESDTTSYTSTVTSTTEAFSSTTSSRTQSIALSNKLINNIETASNNIIEDDEGLITRYVGNSDISPADDSAFDGLSNSSSLFGVSPIALLRDSTSNARWFEENLNDFSLTSLLGHLDEIDATGDTLDPPSNVSIISETSVDYRHKFQDITAFIKNQDKD